VLKVATKFIGNTASEQMNHIYQELAEVDNELWLYKQHGKTDRLAEELVDLQMACETMLAIVGLGEQEREEVRKKVIEKNAKRGYYAL
jgi:hypothetical protein